LVANVVANINNVKICSSLLYRYSVTASVVQSFYMINEYNTTIEISMINYR